MVFAVCAGYQLVGTGSSPRASRYPGLGLLDLTHDRGDRAGVGETAPRTSTRRSALPALTGFENHGGRTHLGPASSRWPRVTGVGNDGTEGAYSGRVVGTYLHGPALVRNPALADLLLGWATGPLPAIDPRREDLVTKLRADRLAAAQPVLG